jgi:hypothetical protein
MERQKQRNGEMERVTETERSRERKPSLRDIRLCRKCLTVTNALAYYNH